MEAVKRMKSDMKAQERRINEPLEKGRKEERRGAHNHVYGCVCLAPLVEYR